MPKNLLLMCQSILSNYIVITIISLFSFHNAPSDGCIIKVPQDCHNLISVSVQSSIHGDNTFVTCMKGLSDIVFLTYLIVTELM